MPKEPKYKKGFTLRHHLDEWWDRRPNEWKVKLLVLVGLAATVGVLGSLLWVHRWMERDELLAQAKELHGKRIQGVDRRMAAEATAPVQPLMPPSASLEVRPGE